MCVRISIYIISHVQVLGQKPIMIQSCITYRARKTEASAKPCSTSRAKYGLVERLCILVEQRSTRLLTWSSHLIRSSSSSIWLSSPSNTSLIIIHTCTHHQTHQTPLVHSKLHQTPTYTIKIKFIK